MSGPGLYDDDNAELGAWWSRDGHEGLDVPVREHPRQESPDPGDLYELGQRDRADQRREHERSWARNA